MSKKFVLFIGRNNAEPYHDARDEYGKATAAVHKNQDDTAVYHLTEALNHLDKLNGGPRYSGFRIQVLNRLYLISIGRGDHVETSAYCAAMAEEYRLWGRKREAAAHDMLAANFKRLAAGATIPLVA
jgi:hypothetical protein